MNNLNKFLHSVNDTEFRQLELRLQIARMLRDAEIHYKLTMAQMTKKLDLKPLEYLCWRNGAIDFNLRQIAEINVLLGDLIRKKTLEEDLIKIK